jgi:hypothetical protein
MPRAGLIRFPGPPRANAPWASRRGPASGLVLIAASSRIEDGFGRGSVPLPDSLAPAEDHIERYPRSYCQSAAKFVASSEAFASSDRFGPVPIRLPRRTATVRMDSKSTAA